MNKKTSDLSRKIQTVLTLFILLTVVTCAFCACTSHTHTFEEGYSGYDDRYHWHKATCEHTDAIEGREPHEFVDGYCRVCKYPEKHTHTFEIGYSGFDDNYHWHVATCEHTSEISGREPHKFIDGVCDVCGQQQKGYVHQHTFEEGYSGHDENYHWHIATCEHTDEISGREPHEFVDGVCIYCDEKQAMEHVWFDANGGNCEIGYKQFFVGAPMTDLPVPTRQYYSFVCWLDENEQAYTDASSMPNKSLTLTAKWEVAPDMFIYDENDATRIIGVNAYDFTELTIPQGVQSIGDSAFVHCGYLTNLTIPDSVTVIGSYAFSDCVLLQNVVIPNSVTSLGENAFSNCWELKSVVIGNGLSAIESLTFGECKNLMHVTLGSDVQSIAESAFSECYHLVEVCNKSALNIVRGATSNGRVGLYALNVYSEGESKLEKDDNGFVIYNGDTVVNYFGENQSVTIPDGIQSINDYAFYRCNTISNVKIPSCVETVGDYAFAESPSITSIVMEEGVKSIGNSAFAGVWASSISIPNSITSMGAGALPNIETYYEDEYAKYLGNESNNFVILVRGKDNISESIVKDGTKIILSGAFVSAELTHITIPDSVLTLTDAFKNCPNLAKISFNGSIDDWLAIEGLQSIMKNDSNYKSLYFNGELLTDVEISSGISEIPAYAFYRVRGIKSVVIPDGVTSIGKYAFANCSSLSKVTIPDSITYVGDGVFLNCSALQYNKYDNANYLGNDANRFVVLMKAINTGITSCDINENTKIIYETAFSQCASLTDIVIPQGVTLIGDSAFSRCTDLTNVVIPSGVTEVRDNAFYRCDNLKEITIPDTVEKLSRELFELCKNLTVINFDGTLVQWKNLEKEFDWDSLTGEYTVVCKDGRLDKNGNVIE